MESQTFQRLQLLTRKLDSNPVTPPLHSLHPEPPFNHKKIQLQIKNYNDSSLNELNNAKDQICQMLNQVHQHQRISNINFIKNQNHLDDAKNQIASIYKISNITTKNIADHMESQVKIKEKEITTTNINYENQIQGTMNSLRKKGMKLASSIFSELQNYKQFTRKHMEADQHKLHNKINEIKQMIYKETRDRKQSFLQLSKLVQDVEQKINGGIQVLSQDRDSFFKRLLVELEKNLQKIIGRY